MKRETRKIVFAILLNIFVAGLGVFILDTLDIFTFGQVIGELGLDEQKVPKIEERYLLEKEELRKQWNVLNLKEKQLTVKLEQLRKTNSRLQDKEKRLLDLSKQMKDREKKLKQLSISKLKREARIRAVANQLINMPPERSVARLEQQKDDLLVIEILRMMDQIFTEQGKQSLVPYLLSLMDKKRAAVIQRKMANIPPVNKDNL